MKVFVVFREGVYRHECGGVFETEDSAIQAAQAFADEELDRYHNHTVTAFDLGSRVPLNLNERERFMGALLDEPKPLYSVKKGETR